MHASVRGVARSVPWPPATPRGQQPVGSSVCRYAALRADGGADVDRAPRVRQRVRPVVLVAGVVLGRGEQVHVGLEGQPVHLVDHAAGLRVLPGTAWEAEVRAGHPPPSFPAVRPLGRLLNEPEQGQFTEVIAGRSGVEAEHPRQVGRRGRAVHLQLAQHGLPPRVRERLQRLKVTDIPPLGHVAKTIVHRFLCNPGGGVRLPISDVRSGSGSGRPAPSSTSRSPSVARCGTRSTAVAPATVR